MPTYAMSGTDLAYGATRHTPPAVVLQSCLHDTGARYPEAPAEEKGFAKRLSSRTRSFHVDFMAGGRRGIGMGIWATIRDGCSECTHGQSASSLRVSGGHCGTVRGYGPTTYAYLVGAVVLTGGYGATRDARMWGHMFEER
eukprot:1316865-Rhodomonas_salina.4